MSNPILIEFVQISNRAVGGAASVAFVVERTFQNSMHEGHNFREDAGPAAMIAIVADDGLKPRRQESHIAGLQLFRADGACEQIWKNARQPEHPNFEITRRELQRTALFERAYGHSNQTKYRVLRFMFWQE